VASKYLRYTYGNGVFGITPSLSTRSYAWFQQYLHAYQQQEQARHLNGWDEGFEEWKESGMPMDNPDGDDEEESPREYGF